MTEQRLVRWMALSGAISAGLLAVGFVGLGSSLPTENAPAAEVVTFYKDHLAQQRASTVFVVVGAVLFVFFGAAIRHGLRREGTGDTLAGVAFAGSVIVSAGLLVGEAIHFTLTAVGDNGLNEAARALNVLDNNDFYPIVGGMAILLLATGIATVRGSVLPRWLGWASIVLGILGLAGPLGVVVFVLTPVWMILVSIVLFRKADPVAASSPSTSVAAN